MAKREPYGVGRRSPEADDALGNYDFNADADASAVDRALAAEPRGDGSIPALGPNQTQPVGSPQPAADPTARDKAVGEWWKSIQPGESPESAYKRAYQNFLGRDVDEGSLAGFRQNGGSLLNYVNDLYDSPEGQAFRARPAAAETPTGAAAQGRVVPSAAPSGWDQTKWASGHNSPKYQVGRILASYNLQDPLERQLAEAEILKAFPGSTFDGKDVFNFPGLGAIDVYGGASAGRYDPQFLDVAAHQAATGGGGGGGRTMPTLPIGPGRDPMQLALATPQGSFGMLDYLMKIMAMNKLFDPNSNLMLGRG